MESKLLAIGIILVWWVPSWMVVFYVIADSGRKNRERRRAAEDFLHWEYQLLLDGDRQD